MNQRIITVMAYQRSGTHMLGSTCASHPRIKYTGEIFVNRPPGSRAEVLAMIDRVRGGGFPVICLDTKYNQISEALEEFLAQPEVKVIHLIRRNHLRLYFSGELHTWTTTYPGRPIPIFEFDELRFRDLVSEIESFIQRFRYLADLTFYYEDLTQDRDIEMLPESAARSICKLAGVEYQALPVRVRKDAPTDVAPYLSGIPDCILQRYDWPGG